MANLIEKSVQMIPNFVMNTNKNESVSKNLLHLSLFCEFPDWHFVKYHDVHFNLNILFFCCPFRFCRTHTRNLIVEEEITSYFITQ